MEPILSKQEIADLLRTLQKDGGPPPAAKPYAPPKDVAEHIDVNLLDLPVDARQKSHLPNLNLIIDRFRSGFARLLSHYLQKKVTLHIIDFHSLAFSDYLPEQEHHKSTAILSLAPLNGGCLLKYDAHLWFLLLEQLLGGGGGEAGGTTARAPTKLEVNLLKATMELACQAIDQAFIPVLKLSSRVIETTAEERLSSFAPQDAVVAVYRFEAAIEQQAGVLELVVPIDSLAPCRPSLDKLTRLQNFETSNWPERIRTGVGAMPVTLAARCCSIDLSIRQLLNLNIGDVLPLPNDPESSVEILVEGVPKFTGVPGQHNHCRNVKITKIHP